VGLEPSRFGPRGWVSQQQCKECPSTLFLRDGEPLLVGCEFIRGVYLGLGCGRVWVVVPGARLLVCEHNKKREGREITALGAEFELSCRYHALVVSMHNTGPFIF
jgi:hypothetical protein